MKRRAFLSGLFKLGLLSVSLPGLSLAKAKASSEFFANKPFEFSNETDHLGRIYLAHYPNDIHHCQELYLKFAQSSNKSPAEQQKLWQILSKQIQQDFKEGDIVKLQGWILSRTELRLTTLNVL